MCLIVFPSFVSKEAPAKRGLTFRARKILYAAITEYIASGEPVGSRRLARRYGLNLSPATIRNVLSDLEDGGYLAQPHTSAGRVPTDRGFRVFVDALVQMREVSADNRNAIIARMSELKGRTDDLMRESGKLLSSLTGAASVIVSPRPQDEQLAQLRFLPLRPMEVLAVLVTTSGAIQNRVVKLDRDVASDELARFHNYLEALVGNRNLAQIRDALARQLKDERGRYVSLNREVTDLVDRTLEQEEWEPQVVIEGQGRLFDRPEFSNAEKIRAFLRTLDDQELLLTLLDETLAAGGVHVRIGAEANLQEVQDVSVISANYQHDEGAVGTVGVIGPARIDYGKVVPLVEFTARVMGETLRDVDSDD